MECHRNQRFQDVRGSGELSLAEGVSPFSREKPTGLRVRAHLAQLSLIRQ